jgi:hypothetical protein
MGQEETTTNDTRDDDIIIDYPPDPIDDPKLVDPDEPDFVPENETRNDGDDGAAGGGSGGGNVTVDVACLDILQAMFETDKKTYKLGEDATVRGQFSAKRGDENYNMPVEVTYTSPSGKEYGLNNVWPEYSGGGCGFLNFHFTIENVAEPGTWKVSAVYPRLKLDMDRQFVVYPGMGISRCEDIGSPGNGNADDDY